MRLNVDVLKKKERKEGRKNVNYNYIHTCILNDTSKVTDRVFAIFSKLCKILKRKFQGSAKNI